MGQYLLAQAAAIGRIDQHQVERPAAERLGGDRPNLCIRAQLGDIRAQRINRAARQHRAERKRDVGAVPHLLNQRRQGARQILVIVTRR